MPGRRRHGENAPTEARETADYADLRSLRASTWRASMGCRLAFRIASLSRVFTLRGVSWRDANLFHQRLAQRRKCVMTTRCAIRCYHESEKSLRSRPEQMSSPQLRGERHG